MDLAYYNVSFSYDKFQYFEENIKKIITDLVYSNASVLQCFLQFTFFLFKIQCFENFAFFINC